MKRIRLIGSFASVVALSILVVLSATAQAQQQLVAAVPADGATTDTPADHCSFCGECTPDVFGCWQSTTRGDGCGGGCNDSCDPGTETCGHAVDLRGLRMEIQRNANLAFLMGPSSLVTESHNNTALESIGGLPEEVVSLSVPPAGVTVAEFSRQLYALSELLCPVTTPVPPSATNEGTEPEQR
jgi:hypothetical protein